MEGIDEHRAPWDCVLKQDDEQNCQPGKAPDSDQAYFEVLCLCLLQAGLNWASIRKHWPKYREGFLSFDIVELAHIEAAQLLERPGIIKNRRKVEAMIYNAREFELITKEDDSFANYLATLKPLPEPEQIKALTGRFKQVGKETAEYFFHAVGFGQ